MHNITNNKHMYMLLYTVSKIRGPIHGQRRKLREREATLVDLDVVLLGATPGRSICRRARTGIE